MCTSLSGRFFVFGLRVTFIFQILSKKNTLNEEQSQM